MLKIIFYSYILIMMALVLSSCDFNSADFSSVEDRLVKPTVKEETVALKTRKVTNSKFQIGDCIGENTLDVVAEEDWIVIPKPETEYKIVTVGKNHYRLEYHRPEHDNYLNGRIISGAPSFTGFDYINGNYIKLECN